MEAGSVPGYDRNETRAFLLATQTDSNRNTMKHLNATKAAIAGLLAIGLLGYALAKDDDRATSSSLASPIINTPANFKLAGAITDTTWEWDLNGERLKFGKDGLIHHPQWEERGLVTSWKAIDEHTVLLTIEKGRRTDRYAILVFNADFTKYAGYDFHGARRMQPCKRIQD